MKIPFWEEYIRSLNGKSPARSLAPFHSRYNLAAKFQGLKVNDMRNVTLEIYSAVTKLGLAYASLEQIERFMQIDNHPSIGAQDLADRARGLFKNKIPNIDKHMYLNEKLENRLTILFEDDNSSDVRALVEVLRHSLFHGAFTPTSWGMANKRESAELLEGLAQVTMRKAGAHFSNWYKSNYYAQQT